MSHVESFEDLVAWQKARSLTKAIYQVTGSEKFARNFTLVDQIRRAAISIMSNIAEGFERGNRGEFHHFLVIAKASCAEVRSQLYIALDAGYLNQVEFESLMNQAQELARVVGGLRAAVEKQWKDQRNPKR
ncbi:MAG TPA: four helix bundle protein [Phototrophicaceae bacterium]|nr:four helix bundle protein [Phototrophicaceae bacterium]